MGTKPHIIRLLQLSILCILISSCSTNKHLSEGQYLLTKNKVIVDSKKINTKELSHLIKQKTNKRFLGVIPIYLNLYNLDSERKNNSWFKKIGEPPVILKQRLLRKSASQIELHFKNRGFLDAQVSFKIQHKKHKAIAIFQVERHTPYLINEVHINHNNNSKLSTYIEKVLSESKISPNQKYHFDNLESARNNIAKKLQNIGFYRFNKEYIHFIADTNQTQHTVDLTLIVNDFEKKVEENTIQEKHRAGIIQEVNVYINTTNSLQNDTIFLNGINFIFDSKKYNYNLNRISKKILIRTGLHYNKTLVDKSYQALAELNIFKKISFEFSPSHSDQEYDLLHTNIYLNSGNKIAYTLEAEATSNPELREGISGKATISHYNIFRGAEHLQLSYKGSNNFNNIKENGVALNLSIPSLVSPFQLNRVLNKNSKTKTVFSTSVTEQQRPEFIRNSIRASYSYQWKTRENYRHKLSLFNLSYVNFQGDSADLSSISEYLIAKDYSNHLIPTSSYTFNYNNLNQLKNHSFFRIHIESSGSILNSLASTFNLGQLKNEQGELILQPNGEPSYTLRIWNQENIFTQYVKATLDYRHYWEIDKKNSFAYRIMGGAIYAFGNTQQAPFHKKFVAGGANDLRGWQAFKRPTGALSLSDTLYTGGLKLISSLEYRFNLIKKLKGAVFMDAGNIWELESNNYKYEKANFHWDYFINQVAVNVGVGIRYDFQYFILRTDIGFPVREPYEGLKWQWNKVSLNDSQLNIGLGYPF